jgi:hypothetical protein
MARNIIYVPTRFAESANRFTFTTSYNGISNFAALIAKYTSIQLVPDTTGNKIDYNGCGRFSSGKLTKYALPLDVYNFIVTQLADKISADIVGKTALNSDAAFLITLFVNIGYLKTSEWGAVGYADAVTYFSGNSFFLPLRFSPKTELGENITINGIAGIFGTNSIADGANSILINGLTSFVGKSATVEIYNYAGVGGTFNSLATATGTVGAKGDLSLNPSITYTPGDLVFFRFNSIDSFASGVYAGKVFQAAKLGYGASFNGASLERMVDDAVVSLIFA